jgi:hypothetical protein
MSCCLSFYAWFFTSVFICMIYRDVALSISFYFWYQKDILCSTPKRGLWVCYSRVIELLQSVFAVMYPSEWSGYFRNRRLRILKVI